MRRRTLAQVTPLRKEARILTLALGLLLVAALAAPTATAGNHDNNAGTIKIHDSEETDPEQRNVPHVSCDFFVEGFNMNDPSGWLVFYSWPPTGDMTEVEPTGDDLEWESDAENEMGNHHFMKGPYQLPVGHYRVEAYTDDGHPGHEHFAEAKTFWVEECEAAPPNPPCPDGLVAVAESDGDVLLTWTPVQDVTTYNVYRAVGEGEFEYLSTVEGTTFTDETTEVGVTYQYYVTATTGDTESVGCMIVEVTAIPFFPTLALGALALIGSVGAYAILRRRG